MAIPEENAGISNTTRLQGVLLESRFGNSVQSTYLHFQSIIINGLDILFISYILANFGDWHDLEAFGRSVSPPIYWDGMLFRCENLK